MPSASTARSARAWPVDWVGPSLGSVATLGWGEVDVADPEGDRRLADAELGGDVGRILPSARSTRARCLLLDLASVAHGLTVRRGYDTDLWVSASSAGGSPRSRRRQRMRLTPKFWSGAQRSYPGADRRREFQSSTQILPLAGPLPSCSPATAGVTSATVTGRHGCVPRTPNDQFTSGAFTAERTATTSPGSRHRLEAAERAVGAGALGDRTDRRGYHEQRGETHCDDAEHPLSGQQRIEDDPDGERGRPRRHGERAVEQHRRDRARQRGERQRDHEARTPHPGETPVATGQEQSTGRDDHEDAERDGGSVGDEARDGVDDARRCGARNPVGVTALRLHEERGTPQNGPHGAGTHNRAAPAPRFADRGAVRLTRRVRRRRGTSRRG